MLSIYPRHLQSCSQKLKAKGLSSGEIRTYRRCGCPLWLIGNDPHGVYHRHTLDTTSWQTAEAMKRDIELGVKAAPKITVPDALDRWKSALLAAKRGDRTVAHVHGAMAASLSTWTRHVGIEYLHELELTRMNEWVATWSYASSTHRCRIDLARSFFKFAIAHKWITENPAAGLIKPKEDLEPTLPFTAEEESKIFAASQTFGTRRHYDGLWSANPETALALMLVMRWTGLRATDSVLFEPRRIKTVTVDGRDVSVYETYQTKTGEWVMCPLPAAAAAAISNAPRLSEASAFIPSDPAYKATPRAVANSFYCNYLCPISRIAAVPGVRAHRFRDTFAVRLLEQGKPLEIVQMLLGHSSIKTTEKHYSPWVKTRREHLIREVAALWN